MRATSPIGIRLIQTFEGLRLQAYKDSVGVWTIGYGHTENVHDGMSISKQEATTILMSDLAKFERCVNMAVKVDIDQNEFDALVSFAFNLGCNALLQSTLLRKLNSKDYNGAANEFLRWNKAGGKELKGLTRRREAERALFITEPTPQQNHD